MLGVSGLPDAPLAVQAADGPDYLRLPLAWTPTRRSDDHGVCEYRLPLGGGNVAILQLIEHKVWAMKITHAGGQPNIERGLFGTPHDALMVLVGEFVFPGDGVGPLQAQP